MSLITFPLCRPTEYSPAYDLLQRISPVLDLENGPWVAGGVVRRILTHDAHDAHDIDVFFANEDQRHRATPRLRELEEEWRKSVNENYTSWPEILVANSSDHGLRHHRSATLIPLQLISKQYFTSSEALIDDIDFTICQMVTDGKVITCPHRSLNDLNERRLRISDKAVVKTPSRIFRYFSYGFEPDETVMTVAQKAPERAYYDVSAGGLASFNPLIEEMRTRDLGAAIILSKVADLMIERDNGLGIAYLYGFPMPAPLAYIFLFGEGEHGVVEKKMNALWREYQLGDSINYTSRPQISAQRFFDAYRQAYREEQ